MSLSISPIRRANSRSPLRRDAGSRSPIRDAVSMIVDSDDDDDDEIINVVAQHHQQQRSNVPTPELASTYSSSTEGGAVKSKQVGGNDHSVDNAEGGAHSSPSAATTATNATVTTTATAATVATVGAAVTQLPSRRAPPPLPPPPEAVGVDLSAIENNSNSSTRIWRRREIQIATSEPSPFALAPPSMGSAMSGNNNNQNNHPNRYAKHQVDPNNSNHNSNINPNSYHQSPNSIPITPLHQIPYVHGGYAAAAPLFVTHSKFASILKKLLPGAYEELSCLLQNNNKNKGRKNTNGNGNGNGNGNANKSSGDMSQSQTVNKAPSSDKSNSNNKVDYERMTSCSPTLEEVAGSVRSKSINSSIVTANNGNGESDGGGNGSGSNPTPEVILPDPVKVMKWAENNPVVSAFGIWSSDSGRRTIKFMQGINLCNTSCLDEHHQDGIFNDWNDRESVVTIGSNGNYSGFGSGFGGFGGSYAGGSGIGGYYGVGGNNGHFQRPKRRKQPQPEDSGNLSDPSNSSMPSRPSYSKPALEWDVFLDPNLVREVDAAMGVVDNLELKLRKARIKRQKRIIEAKKQKEQNKRKQQHNRVSTNNNNGDDSSDDEIEDNDDFDILQAHTAAQVEVDRLVSQLMRRLIIAHGSMSQLVLEAMGVAPKYNFGRVVKSSRENPNGATAGALSPVRTPSRSMKRVSLRAGKTEFSLNVTRTSSWDEEEEQRDFEALLDPTIGSGAVAGKDSERELNKKNRQRRTAAKSSASSGSKGMFLETWLHVFARTLSLLVKSSSGNSSSISKQNSSASSNSRNSRENNDSGHLMTKNRPANIGQRGLSGLLEKMFLRRDSSYPNIAPKIGGDLDDTIDEEKKNNINQLEALHDDDDDDNSALLTPNDMFSPETPTAASTLYSSAFGMCGVSLCLGMDSDGSEKGGTSSFPLNPHASHKMAQDIERITSVLGEPLRLVLDLKSRRVPPRVWSRLIDSLRTRGLIIEGIGSFDMDELRVISKGCSYPLTPILFFHSVGDLQRACHANEVKNGDTVYFNGGSLMWKRSTIMEAAERGCCGAIDTSDFDDGHDGVSRSPKVGSVHGGRGNYSFQPYAYPRSALSDWEREMCKATIEDYRRHFNLKIGVYVQEFSISAEALDALTIFVNKHGEVYDQGLAFGGVNGTAVKNIHGDGYWNQRYMGRSWDFVAKPSNEMTPLKPEDHHLVQKAIQAGAWGQVGTIYEVMDEKAGALTVPPPREPCNVVNTFQ
eukprot:CAMPEP_0183709826 /NCGR_PEP_ID=MMETSP0737-20130205/5790_1 /TAXON_ID=385413 /ORGANISM="Thalassiosira miniscula, Strain CCMP1093" /LENGTH=1240 /DNA_ID=CAMNT_0025938027 /DNA_START=285 /DNA_END=4007 /DNA_ORIENTATION=-